MKKVSKLLVVFFMLVLSMNFVMADIVGPGDNRPVPTRPETPKSSNFMSPTVIIIIGVVLAVVAAAVVIFGLNKLKNDELNETQMAFGSSPNSEKTAQSPVDENEKIEEKEDEADEEIM